MYSGEHEDQAPDFSVVLYNCGFVLSGGGGLPVPLPVN